MGNDVRGEKHTIIIAIGHHRFAAIGELRKDNAKQCRWTRENIEVSINMRVDGTALYYIEIMKNRKLLNNVLSKALPCVSFLDLIRSVIAYARTFADC